MTSAEHDQLALLWNVLQVQRRLNVGRSTVFDLIGSGELRSVKVGRRRLVSEAALRDYVERLDTQQAAVSRD